jgi:hypothetical protein
MEKMIHTDEAATETAQVERPAQPPAAVQQKNRNLRPLLAAGVTIVLWASAFPGIRAGLSAYSPAHLALLRYGVAALTLTIYALATRMRLPRWRDLLSIALLSLVGISFYNVALNTGEVSVPAFLSLLRRSSWHWRRAPGLGNGCTVGAG